jgi:regulator of RNase E activity RraA
VRDLDEMTSAGFKALARRLCVGHAHVAPVRWNCEVEVFGTKVRPGQLIHADKHGFLAIPEGEEKRLLEAARFMDENECTSVIPAAFAAAGLTADEICQRIDEAATKFGAAVKTKFNNKGEWA